MSKVNAGGFESLQPDEPFRPIELPKPKPPRKKASSGAKSEPARTSQRKPAKKSSLTGKPSARKQPGKKSPGKKAPARKIRK